MPGPIDISNFTKSDPESDAAAERVRALAAEALLAPLAGATFTGTLGIGANLAAASGAVQTVSASGPLSTNTIIAIITTATIALDLSSTSGRLVFIKNISSGAVTLNAPGGWTVNNGSTYSLGAGLGVLLFSQLSAVDVRVLLA